VNPHDRDERGTRNMRLVLDCLQEHSEGRTQAELSQATGLKTSAVRNAINDLSSIYPIGEEEYAKCGEITMLNYFLLDRHSLV